MLSIYNYIIFKLFMKIVDHWTTTYQTLTNRGLQPVQYFLGTGPVRTTNLLFPDRTMNLSTLRQHPTDSEFALVSPLPIVENS